MNMVFKRWPIIMVVLLGVSIGFGGGYLIFGNEGIRSRHVGAERARFVTAIHALNKIEDGDLDTAIAILEGSYYSAALNLISANGGTNDAFLEIMLPELISYRNRHATNAATWSEVEKRLSTYLN